MTERDRRLDVMETEKQGARPKIFKKVLDKQLNICYNKYVNKRNQHRKEVSVMTKREMYAEIRKAVIDNAEMVAFIDHEVELLDKKKSASKKPTKTQIENEGFKATIMEYLTRVDAPKNIKEIQAEVLDMATLTNQRITHLLTDLVKSGAVSKEYVKKTPYYSITA